MKKQINKKLVIKGLNKKALSNLYGGKYLISNYMIFSKKNQIITNKRTECERHNDKSVVEIRSVFII